MKFLSGLAVVIASAALVFSGSDALAAKRLGGGKSVGQQSSNVNKQQAPANANANNTAQKPAAAPAATPAKPALGGMAGILGGLAAGLGLAWLASSLGLGGAMANIMTAVLIGLLIFLVIGFIMRKRAQSQGGGMQPAYANKDYSPTNVGNDSAARPFERTTIERSSNTGGSMIGSGIGSGVGSSIDSGSTLGQTQAWGIPADFDTTGFLTAAKQHYITLQAAWDKGDQGQLRSMLTEEMMTEVRAQLAEREAGASQHNEIVSLDAQLLGIEEISATRHYMASVEFSGTQRDEPGVSPAPFREVWNLTKPIAGGGWLVAGIQSLD